MSLVVGALDAALSAVVEKEQDSAADNVRTLVGAIQRANAAMAPLGHRMLDEALVVLHRLGSASGSGRMPPLSVYGAAEPLGPNCPGILGIGFLGGLLAIEELIQIHVAPGKPYDVDALTAIFCDAGFRACTEVSIQKVSFISIFKVFRLCFFEVFTYYRAA